jgi:hypothetical protein
MGELEKKNGMESVENKIFEKLGKLEFNNENKSEIEISNIELLFDNLNDEKKIS